MVARSLLRPLTGVVLAALLTPFPALPQTPAVELDPRLRQEIGELIANVWDQKMARRYQMSLDLPPVEVEARLEILARWAKAIRDGAFAAGVGELPSDLPKDFDQRLEAMRQLVKQAKTSAGTDLDPVLRFLEENADALQQASGIPSTLPSARG